MKTGSTSASRTVSPIGNAPIADSVPVTPEATVTPRLLPGDSEPGKPVQTAHLIKPRLLPGETDREPLIVVPAIVVPRLAPGDGPESEHETVAWAPFGPGAVAVPRPIIRRRVR